MVSLPFACTPIRTQLYLREVLISEATTGTPRLFILISRKRHTLGAPPNTNIYISSNGDTAAFLVNVVLPEINLRNFHSDLGDAPADGVIDIVFFYDNKVNRAWLIRPERSERRRLPA